MGIVWLVYLFFKTKNWELSNECFYVYARINWNYLQLEINYTLVNSFITLPNEYN